MTKHIFNYFIEKDFNTINMEEDKTEEKYHNLDVGIKIGASVHFILQCKFGEDLRRSRGAIGPTDPLALTLGPPDVQD